MSFFLPHPVHPKFVKWFNDCHNETQALITSFWHETATHPDLSPHGGTSVEYARKYRTMQFCAEKYGYPFP